MQQWDYGVKQYDRADQDDNKDVDDTSERFGDRKQRSQFQPYPIDEPADQHHDNKLDYEVRHGSLLWNFKCSEAIKFHGRLVPPKASCVRRSILCFPFAMQNQQ